LREIVFSRLALKDRAGMPKAGAADIGLRLAELANNERANLDIRPLQGHKPWQRLRVGDYRVVFREVNNRVEVARVVSRQELDAAVRKLS